VNLLGKLFDFLNTDLTGKTWEKEVEHSYFKQLFYFGHKNPSKCYWEAELESPEGDNISIIMIGTPESPTTKEEEFCRVLMSDLDSLFEKCRPVFESEYLSWVKQPLPFEWKTVFKLDGFNIPLNGDAKNKWEVIYYVKPIGHYFTAIFEQGKAVGAYTDG